MQHSKNSTETEYESKSLLLVNEYLKLLSHFNLKRENAIPQCNSFFDTRDKKLNKFDITLRVRVKKGNRELTLKKEAEDGGRKELNYSPMSDRENFNLIVAGTIPKSDVANVIKELSINESCLYQGDLVTDRIEIKYKGCKLAIDDNHYLGTSDYEIELERDDPSADEKELMYQLLGELKIPLRPAKGKRKRFFEYKSLRYKAVKV